MEAFKELSFLGRLSSIVRTPYKVLKKTSSDSSPGCSSGIWGADEAELAI
jgi:hypothetical protein